MLANSRQLWSQKLLLEPPAMPSTSSSASETLRSAFGFGDIPSRPGAAPSPNPKKQKNAASTISNLSSVDSLLLEECPQLSSEETATALQGCQPSLSQDSQDPEEYTDDSQAPKFDQVPTKPSDQEPLKQAHSASSTLTPASRLATHSALLPSVNLANVAPGPPPNTTVETKTDRFANALAGPKPLGFSLSDNDMSQVSMMLRISALSRGLSLVNSVDDAPADSGDDKLDNAAFPAQQPSPQSRQPPLQHQLESLQLRSPVQPAEHNTFTDIALSVTNARPAAELKPSTLPLSLPLPVQPSRLQSMQSSPDSSAQSEDDSISRLGSPLTPPSASQIPQPVMPSREATLNKPNEKGQIPLTPPIETAQENSSESIGQNIGPQPLTQVPVQPLHLQQLSKQTLTDSERNRPSSLLLANDAAERRSPVESQAASPGTRARTKTPLSYSDPTASSRIPPPVQPIRAIPDSPPQRHLKSPFQGASPQQEDGSSKAQATPVTPVKRGRTDELTEPSEPVRKVRRVRQLRYARQTLLQTPVRRIPKSQAKLPYNVKPAFRQQDFVTYERESVSKASSPSSSTAKRPINETAERTPARTPAEPESKPKESPATGRPTAPKAAKGYRAPRRAPSGITPQPRTTSMVTEPTPAKQHTVQQPLGQPYFHPSMVPPSTRQPPVGQPLMGPPNMGQPLRQPLRQPPQDAITMGQPIGQPAIRQPFTGQLPGGQFPEEQMCYGSTPLRQTPLGQVARGQMPPGQLSPRQGHPPQGQPPLGQLQLGQSPLGHPRMGQSHLGHSHPGQSHLGQSPLGQPPLGPLPLEQVLLAQDVAGLTSTNAALNASVSAGVPVPWANYSQSPSACLSPFANHGLASPMTPPFRGPPGHCCGTQTAPMCIRNNLDSLEATRRAQFEQEQERIKNDIRLQLRHQRASKRQGEMPEIIGIPLEEFLRTPESAAKSTTSPVAVMPPSPPKRAPRKKRGRGRPPKKAKHVPRAVKKSAPVTDRSSILQVVQYFPHEGRRAQLESALPSQQAEADNQFEDSEQVQDEQEEWNGADVELEEPEETEAKEDLRGTRKVDNAASEAPEAAQVQLRETLHDQQGQLAWQTHHILQTQPPQSLTPHSTYEQPLSQAQAALQTQQLQQALHWQQVQRALLLNQALQAQQLQQAIEASKRVTSPTTR